MSIKQAFFALPCSLVLATSLTVRAAEPAKGTGDEKKPLTVSAQVIERPLMKYRLMPGEDELRAGNAAPILLRLGWERNTWFAEIVPKFEHLLDCPLSDPELRDKGDLLGEGMYRELKRAAHRRNAEWDYPIGEQSAANILLPDIQGSRTIVGRGLSVWIRHHIARGELTEARDGISTGLAVLRHYARSPFIITQLVCKANSLMLLARVEELIAQPGCPNLYWALSALPRPLIDLRPSIELEQHFLEMTVPELTRLDEVRGEEQWLEIAKELATQFQAIAPGSVELNKQTLERVAKRARTELPAWQNGGAARVASMSDIEAAVRWFVHVHEDQAQETSAIMSLQPPIAVPRLQAWEQRLTELKKTVGLPSLFVLDKPLGVFVGIHSLQRQIDALRIVEAIRNYASMHAGQLPETLDKIPETPIPDDVLTGKPFHYEVAAEGATLAAPPILVEGKPVGGVHYRIKIRK